jgi:tRNA/rRNA methyltransferase
MSDKRAERHCRSALPRDMVERMRERLDQRAADADDGLPNIRIVLVRPRGSANVGAAARAMKNMGVGELTLVGPAVRRFAAAEAMAVHARDLVRGARTVATVAEAVGDCSLVVGTTCRGGPYRAASEDPETLAPHLLDAAAHGPVAVLFGPEDHGLTNDDLRVCQRLLSIDTSAAYTSLNLAQAVLLVCYALRRAARTGRRVPRTVTPAPAAAVQRMYQHLQRALLSIGFLHPQNPDHLMFALRRLFGRTELEDHEVRILLGMARQIAWAGKSIVTGYR